MNNHVTILSPHYLSISPVSISPSHLSYTPISKSTMPCFKSVLKYRSWSNVIARTYNAMFNYLMYVSCKHSKDIIAITIKVTIIIIIVILDVC